MSGLRHLQEGYERIGDVRGLGLMIGAELTDPDGKPDTVTSKAVVDSCLEQGLILLTCGPWDNTVRFIPPLVVSQEQIDEALGIFERGLAKAAG